MEQMEEVKKSVLQFSNPRITELKFKANSEFDKTKYRGMGVKFESHVNKHMDLTADVDLTVSVGIEEETVPFVINATVSASFMWKDGLEESLIDDLLNCNARVLLLSYLRPFISHLTVDAGYPSFVLPFYDFSESDVEDKKC